MDRRVHMAGDRRAPVRVRMPRSQLRPRRHPARRAASRDGREEKVEVISMHTKIAAALFVLTFAATAPAVAHHAFGGEFDPNRPVLLRGKIVKVEWVNPHAWIHIEVVDKDGTKKVWMVEGGS